MDTFAYIGFVFGIIAMSGVGAIRSKVNKLERKLKSMTEGSTDFSHLVHFIHENQFKKVKIECYNDEINFYGYEMQILDVDEQWILLQAVNKRESKKVLIRIEDIQNITLDEK